jgi:hypothetical protein
MGHVVVAGAAGEAQTPGHGEGAAGVSGGQAQLVGGDLHGTREARVQVDVGHVVDPEAGQTEGLLARQPDGRGGREIAPM